MTRYISLFAGLSILLTPFSVKAEIPENIEPIVTFCKKYQDQQKKSAVQGAEYVPGIDVHGNDVAPPELGGDGNAEDFDIITIPLEIDLAQRYGLILPNGLELKPQIGTLTIPADGAMKYNGAVISNDVKDVCKTVLDELKKNQGYQSEQHGHESGNPVVSNGNSEAKINVPYPPRKPQD